jgi:hypothetical protein
LGAGEHHEPAPERAVGVGHAGEAVDLRSSGGGAGVHAGIEASPFVVAKDANALPKKAGGSMDEDKIVEGDKMGGVATL